MEKRHTLLLAPLVVWGASLFPLGCASSNVENDPEYEYVQNDIKGVKEIDSDGVVTPAERPVRDALLADADARLARIEQRESDAEERFKGLVAKGKGAAEPFIPAPFSGLLDIAAMLGVLGYQTLSHKSSLSKLRGAIDAAKGGPAQ